MGCIKWAMVALVAAVGLGLMTADAQTVLPATKPDTTAPDLATGIARRTKLKLKDVQAMLKAFGPAFVEQIQAGRSVPVAGVGTFQGVRVTEYKDLVNGRPSLMPARNYVEYVPEGAVTSAVNSPGARPARTVDGYDFRVNPSSDAGIRTPSTRSVGTRTR